MLFLSRLRKALNGSLGEIPLNGCYLALAAIGTVADLVPLSRGNRLIVKAGLGMIDKRTFEPVEELCKACGLEAKTLSAGHTGFYLGPRINAAGCMGDTMQAFELLTCDDPVGQSRIAANSNSLNSRRQDTEESVLRSIAEQVASGEAAGGRTFGHGRS